MTRAAVLIAAILLTPASWAGAEESFSDQLDDALGLMRQQAETAPEGENGSVASDPASTNEEDTDSSSAPSDAATETAGDTGGEITETSQ